MYYIILEKMELKKRKNLIFEIKEECIKKENLNKNKNLKNIK